MNNPSSYVVLALVGVSLACQNRISTVEFASPFFDLTGFINERTSDSLPVDVTKYVEINNSRETKELSNYLLYIDIQGFESYDINRPALFNKYVVDTIVDETGIKTTYRALEEDLKVQELTILRQSEQIDSIGIKAETNSFLENMSLHISWKPASGYELNRTTKKIFQDSLKQTVGVIKQG